MNLRAESHRLAQVMCPVCEVKIRPSNFNRHWANQHPGMPIPEKRRLRGYPGGGGGSVTNGGGRMMHMDSSMVEMVHYSGEEEDEDEDEDEGGTQSEEAEQLLSSDDESELQLGGS